MPTQNTSRSRTNESTHSTASKSIFSEIKSFHLGGFSIPELAVLGAAGYVIWKNRENIGELLETNGIEVPEFLKGDVSSLVQSGASMLTASKQDKNSSSGQSRRTMHDA